MWLLTTKAFVHFACVEAVVTLPVMTTLVVNQEHEGELRIEDLKAVGNVLTLKDKMFVSPIPFFLSSIFELSVGG